ncbi:PD40 domain-containing protein [Carboxylicivirga mesophila]|uniref:PD40 domain-containing protein n=1 Tax=Carboxylicivirga mesophila TaxID=1166478 RepID=A0ABS5KB72_9BACT|nr:PD40 domain-containing protein [Carboxylicivirga mesophila]MBS2212264.1 PD40 domain-containing protein [Carboxylicivirga mesophila]
MYNLRSLILVFIFIAGSLQMSMAQDRTYSAQEALALFKDGDYAEAEKAYAALLKRNERDLKHNYYYGICLLQNNNDISQAVKRLKYAALKGVSRDAFYYLGRAYQLSYQFDEAGKQYARFLKYASASDIRNEKAIKYQQECEYGLQQSAKIFSLTVYQRDTVPAEDFLNAYHPAKDVGKVMHNESFFESGLDPKGILYLTERGDEVYFTMTKEDKGEGIYKMEKLLDGWSESLELDGISSEFNERHPFLLIDGSTIFFSSNREGGLGGYDLYKANYDAESKSFSQPVNMGIPFNSPKDDFLFVADEFNSVAWFASNRETNDSTLIVYTIKWDDTVVKNFVEDINQVRSEAELSLSSESYTYGVNGEAKQSDVNASKQPAFRFMVADTLEYTQLDHFKSADAKATFTEAMELQHQKDSLSALMRQKRQAYARTNSDDERAMLVNDILSLEKKVYGLDDSIESSFYQARLTEIEEIKKRVAAGTYSSSVHVKKNGADDKKLQDILIPEEYTFYTDEEFARQLEELEKMYSLLFSTEEIKQLHHADSLYIWGNILNLESSKLLEMANDATDEAESVIAVLRQKDSLEEEGQARVNVDKANELKETALKLYHESLDSKYKIYSNKLRETLIANTVDDLSFMEEAQAGSREYYKEAMELIDPIKGYDLNGYEKSGAVKRTAVSIQEQSLITYTNVVRGEDVKVGEEVERHVPKTYQELQGTAEETKAPAKVVEEAFKKESANQLIYKIQIGVFRNEPDAAAVSKIPPISKVEIPSKGLTKYFAGEYPSYTDAQKDIDQVQSSGFPGAFIVVFKDGKQINLTEELKK